MSRPSVRLDAMNEAGAASELACEPESRLRILDETILSELADDLETSG